jgi:hypothetical protein
VSEHHWCVHKGNSRSILIQSWQSSLVCSCMYTVTLSWRNHDRVLLMWSYMHTIMQSLQNHDTTFSNSLCFLAFLVQSGRIIVHLFQQEHILKILVMAKRDYCIRTVESTYVGKLCTIIILIWNFVFNCTREMTVVSSNDVNISPIL